MTKTEQLEKLFREWRSRSEGGLFVEDGLLSEKDWNQSGLRVVVLLKEPSETNPNATEWKYQDFIRNRQFLEEKGTTWPNLIRWTYGILHGFPPFQEVEENLHMISNSTERFFGSVCFVNVKKTAGSTRSNDEIVYQAGINTGDLLLRQIHILEPNIVLCCGSVVFRIVKDSLENHEIPLEPKMTRGGLERIWWNDLRANIIHYHHPMAFYPKAMTYTYLMNELKSIL
ncbi:hypothetical protein [Effusibacillus lacus]|uniref:Uracil-DNA glycosylase-like domain-containing protein n=1 Tax=Effusibacillus lacus TaxID=1348429 RepID=A0A292YNW3_9BACL|nr:hypothetical protein [Effusibacillus lacus]TCS66739.1 hypothetical protein EDD64_1582 [Effusibacillus lacus]GAX90160.1 hypothetical protein EFBL_1786 [Effusibacillus lacus]